MYKLSLTIILTLFAISAFAGKKSSFDPVQKKYKSKIEYAKKQYLSSMGKIKKLMIKDYEKLLNKAMKQKDLVLANKYQKKIEALKEETEFGLTANPLMNSFSLAGIWDVVYNNSSTRKYSIDENMNITVLESSYKGVGDKGKLKKYKKGWVVLFTQLPQTEFFVRKGETIKIDYWPAGVNYKKAKPAFTAKGKMVKK